MQAIVADFGFARTIGENDDAGQTQSNVGPINWMAPESLSSRMYSEKSDVWSFGITGNDICSLEEEVIIINI